MVVTALAVSLIQPVSAAGAQLKHHGLMAAMISKFPPFAKWPAGTRLRAKKQLSIAVFTKDKSIVEQFAGTLHRKTLGGIKWTVKQVITAEEATKYPIVFFGKDVPEPTDEWYEKLKGEGVLTFGEKAENAARKAVMNFVISGKKVRFDIHLGVAAKAGVRIAPQLGRVARKVVQDE